MPHVTFIHGIANKPPKEKLLEDWIYALIDGGLDLEAAGVTASMVYWADVMYPPDEEMSRDSYESVDAGLGTEQADDDELSWVKELSDSEQAFMAAMRDRLGFDQESPGGEDYVAEPPPEPADDEEGGVQFEAVPLPWFLKRRLMKRFLKDVYYYLFNKPWEHKTTGEMILPQFHIRDLFVQQLKQDAEQNSGGAHVVVSHSMGTVIAYDCLKHLTECPPVTGYMTVGSPLGISEVHDNFSGYNKNNAFPTEKLSGKWINVYDRLDPVALDARLANDYQLNHAQAIEDQRVHNDGAWRHSSWKYFNQQALCDHLRDLLEL